MSLVRFQAKNHRQQIAARGGADEAVDDPNERPPFGCCLLTWGLGNVRARHELSLFEVDP